MSGIWVKPSVEVSYKVVAVDEVRWRYFGNKSEGRS